MHRLFLCFSVVIENSRLVICDDLICSVSVNVLPCFFLLLTTILDRISEQNLTLALIPLVQLCILTLRLLTMHPFIVAVRSIEEIVWLLNSRLILWK